MISASMCRGAISTVSLCVVEGSPRRVTCPFQDSPLGELMLDGSGVAIVQQTAAREVQPSDFTVLIVGPGGDTTVAHSFVYDPVPIPETSIDEAVAQLRSQSLDR